MKFFIILAVYFSLNMSSALADNNLKEERDKITKERNDLAIGWRDNLGYSLPIPGSYQLYNIGKAGDGEVVDGIGDSVRLHELMDGKITLLSFIYSNCTDTNGCPLATSVFYKIQEKLKMDKKVLSKLKMISLSFDPEYDTPEIMNLYGKDLSYIDADWSFLTTDSSRKLDPILSQYDQPVIRKYTENGEYAGVQSHLLRVFLIDDNKLIRNVYNVDFLHPDLLINDIKTLLLSNE
ncbi:SCO family protein [Gammaproteobacteria bacterium]|nr:SCO family protein [Gammaproteobacteria bacterium]MBT7523470.1 SCO family protein [Gammaproteobacteria bacterium]MBT7814748.1 SCO family protein [Gammaproteobacteria bacterium]MDA9896817.1 SCO family protein [Gammaproteobacteria bacterium]